MRWLLHDIDPTLEPAERTLSTLLAIRRTDRRLARMTPGTQIRIARGHLARLRELTREIDELKRELAPLVAAAAQDC